MKVALSPIIGDARGSAGFLSLYLSHYGLVARIKVTPLQPLTPAQFLVRATLTSISQTWRSAAMNAYRAGWIVLANANPYTDVFGATRRLTGSAFFARCNANLATLGLAPIFAAPASVSTGSPGLLSLAHITGPPEHFNVSPTTPPAPTECPVVFATRPLSPGVLKLSNTQRLIQVFAAGDSGPWDIVTAYRKKNSSVATGQQVFVQAKYISNVTGFAGQLSIDTLLW